MGAFYTQVDYDDATDSAGKRAVYDDPRQLELEAGVKLTKTFVMDEGYANLYLKPGIVQRIINGDEVKISNLNKIDTMEDQTLGRLSSAAVTVSPTSCRRMSGPTTPSATTTKRLRSDWS